jgi:AraC-like DNA-binding protein
MPLVTLHGEEADFYNYLYNQITVEFTLNDVSLEEMIRTYLKQIFIKAVRSWKKQNLEKELINHNKDLEFFRKFTILVDAHYAEKHTVADYAELLNIAPKTITNKFKKLNLLQPNEIIKNRIVLQAKRLLVHTTLSAKEISYQLGYDDPAYFTRIFALKTGESPTAYRSKFLSKETQSLPTV